VGKLDKKLNAIYKLIDFVGKGGTNESQHYKYVRAADVVHAVRKAFADGGIYAEVNMEFVGAPYIIARSKDPNAPFSAVNVKCSLILHDMDSDELRTGSGLGTGADLGDKAVYKAQTGALKYALRDALLIPDEADPEADESTDENAEPVSTPRRRTAAKNDVLDAPAEEPKAITAAPDAEPEPNPEAPVQQGREPGDESEPGGEMPADDGTLPTEEEKNEYRNRFNAIVNGLSSSKALTASKGLKVDKKFLVFALQQTGAERTGDVTKAQWVDFLGRAEALSVKENGWVVLAKLVNKANGVEK